MTGPASQQRSVIRLSKSCVGEAEKSAVSGVLDREYLGMGREVEIFESLLQGYLGRKVACVANGTSALQLALQAIGVGQGDEVLVQSLTYLAAYQAISATGAVPISCDIDPATITIDCADAKAKLSSRTKAILPTHYSGGVGNLDEIYQFARTHKLRVVEDAAHSFGSKYMGRRVGSFGDICCFSFDGIKNITAGEGGCVVTSDQNVMSRIEDARLLGVMRDTEKRFSGQRSWEFDVEDQGWRYHMSNVMAAIGIEQFNRKERFFKRRKELVRLYLSELENQTGIQAINSYSDEIVSHIFVVKLPIGINRDQVRTAMESRSIQTGIHYYPNHLLTRYRNQNISLKETEGVFPRLLTLPLHPEVTDDDVRYIVDSLAEAIDIA